MAFATQRPLQRLYDDTRGRIAEVVASDPAPDARVPACPGWSVKDVIAHLVGVGTDVLEGRLEGAATPPWTNAQVAARRASSLADVLAEWDVVGPKFAGLLDDFPGRYGHQVIADLTSHEHDLRGALGRPGARDTANVDLCAAFLVEAILDAALRTFGLGPLEVGAGDRRWVVGSGGPAGGNLDSWRDAVNAAASPPPGGPAVAAVRTDRFTLVRALTGRRSGAQIKGMDWSADPEPYVAAFGFGPFSVRTVDLEE